jgi:hypothetical protein
VSAFSECESPPTGEQLSAFAGLKRRRRRIAAQQHRSYIGQNRCSHFDDYFHIALNAGNSGKTEERQQGRTAARRQESIGAMSWIQGPGLSEQHGATEDRRRNLPKGTEILPSKKQTFQQTSP